MARLIKVEGNYRIYELNQRECEFHQREYPTIVAWDGRYPEYVGAMNMSENESSTLEEMLEWVEKWG